jgi:hypothetical protein
MSKKIKSRTKIGTTIIVRHFWVLILVTLLAILVGVLPNVPAMEIETVSPPFDTLDNPIESTINPHEAASQANWNQYTTVNYEYRILYPTDWTYYEYSRVDSGPDVAGEYRTAVFRNFSTGSLSMDSEPTQIEVLVSYYSTSLPINLWIDKNLHRLINSDDTVEIDHNIIKNPTTIFFSRTNERLAPGYVQFSFLLNSNSRLWKLSASGSTENSAEILNFLENMVRSFDSFESNQ